MPIYAPGKRINPSIMRHDTSRKGVYAGLYLTSMVDMFAIMVIFLLMNFSAEGEIIILPQGLELPKAQNIGTLERAPSIVISENEVLFENEVLIATEEVRKSGKWYIEQIDHALNRFKQEQEAKAIADRDLSQKTKIDLEKINISADRRLPFSLVKKVIYTAGHSGFPRYRFSVFAGKDPQRIKEPEEGQEPETE